MGLPYQLVARSRTRRWSCLLILAVHACTWLDAADMYMEPIMPMSNFPAISPALPALPTYSTPIYRYVEPVAVSPIRAATVEPYRAPTYNLPVEKPWVPPYRPPQQTPVHNWTPEKSTPRAQSPNTGSAPVTQPPPVAKPSPPPESDEVLAARLVDEYLQNTGLLQRLSSSGKVPKN